MSTGKIEQKKIIIEKLINSGINVSPPTLDLILQLNDPLQKINLIIKEISFQTSFNGHLTTDILKKISDNEIQKALERKSINEDTRSILSSNKEIEIISSSIKNDDTSIKESINNLNSDIFNQNTPEMAVSSESDFFIPPKILKNNKNNKNLNKKSLTKNTTESTKSQLSFKPKAKEYDFDYKILKDPTGKIYTNGDYNDFYELSLDKFNTLKKLMKKRGDAYTASNISSVLRLSHQNDISIIGMVNEIRQTKKGNYFLTLEDSTGIVNVILRKDNENIKNKDIERIFNDQMILVSGVYNPGEHGKKGIIYANFFTKIDIRNDFEPKLSNEPLSIALLSDTHIGSKEFEEKLWKRFINFLNGKGDNKNLREKAGRVKYIVINGDLVEGIGVYPNQQEDLVITDIYKQFKKAAELLSEIPDYIKIFYSSGNHDPVRTALPRPAVPNKYAEELINLNVKCIGNPSLIQTHNVKTLIFHGDSMLDLNLLIPGLDNNKPVETMKEILICRHLAPVYGKKTQIAPINKDWLVIDKIPEIFHTGHVHINGMGQYRNISLVNSGTFQSQTDFMNSLGIHPTPGIVPIIDLDTMQGVELDFKKV